MTIRRLPKPSDADEMPAAKIYLDEMREIVEILSSPDSEQEGGDAVVKFRLRGVECESLEELEQIGGRARKFEIEVKRGFRTNTLRSRGYGTDLRLSASEKDFWIKHGKVKRILDSNAIAWKNVANEFLRHLGYTFVCLILLLTAHLTTYHFTTTAAARKVEDEIYYLLLVGYVLGGSIYQMAFAGSVAVLHYAHTKGWRKWVQAHGTQVLLVILGVALKLAGDWIWHHFQR